MLSWLVMLMLLAAVGAAGYCAYRGYVLGDGRFRPDSWFQPRPEPRLGVSEQVTIDGRRKLLLVRRDDVEHLLMIGGPVDLVIEEKIHPPAPAAAKTPPEPAGSVFTRQPPRFGQAVNE